MVDAGRRTEIRKHHTATHLLHKALRDTLGMHVEQKGSLVAPDRLRFDFSHYERVAPDQLRDLERQINEMIQHNIHANIQADVPIEKARERGAMMLFGEKYGDQVRVVQFGNSVELCGGTHVNATGEIGLFQFLSEGSIAGGIRRVEAVVGQTGIAHLQHIAESLGNARNQFKALDQPVESAIADLQDQTRQLEKEVARLKEEQLAVQLDVFVQQAVEVNGIRLSTGRFRQCRCQNLPEPGRSIPK